VFSRSVRSLVSSPSEQSGANMATATHAAHSPPSDLMAQIHAKKALDASPAVQDALDQCTEDDVPILKLLRNACPVGMHGYGCETRWDVHDSFLPRPRRWLKQYNASRVRAAASAGVDCQRAFFDAFGAHLVAAHWEQEWDAQPFRISATPPRTIGKMLHQLITANYYHLTLGPKDRPPLRRDPAPGHRVKPLPQPGFRWQGQLVAPRVDLPDDSAPSARLRAPTATAAPGGPRPASAGGTPQGLRAAACRLGGSKRGCPPSTGRNVLDYGGGAREEIDYQRCRSARSYARSSAPFYARSSAPFYAPFCARSSAGLSRCRETSSPARYRPAAAATVCAQRGTACGAAGARVRRAPLQRPRPIRPAWVASWSWT